MEQTLAVATCQSSVEDQSSNKFTDGLVADELEDGRTTTTHCVHSRTYGADGGQCDCDAYSQFSSTSERSTQETGRPELRYDTRTWGLEWEKSDI